MELWKLFLLLKTVTEGQLFGKKQNSHIRSTTEPIKCKDKTLSSGSLLYSLNSFHYCPDCLL